MDINNNLWESDHYYKKAKESSSDFDYPGMKILKKYSRKSSSILDLGCGDGTRLDYLSNSTNKCVGIDISGKAITLAQKQYPKCEFKVANLEKIPFKNNFFDLVYSAFVLEHLQNPQKVIKEAIRVLKIGGIIILMAPNFGAPNRISPPGKYSRVQKLFSGIVADFIRLFSGTKFLKWRKVKPNVLKDPKDYEIDCDTTIEPYLGDLTAFLKNQNFQILTSSSLWSEEINNRSVITSIIKLLGKIKLFPFVNWGPHLLVVAKKRE